MGASALPVTSTRLSTASTTSTLVSTTALLSTPGSSAAPPPQAQHQQPRPRRPRRPLLAPLPAHPLSQVLPCLLPLVSSKYPANTLIPPPSSFTRHTMKKKNRKQITIQHSLFLASSVFMWLLFFSLCFASCCPFFSFLLRPDIQSVLLACCFLYPYHASTKAHF